MLKFSVWVDADSFPVKARDFIVSHSFSKEVSVNFVANHEIKSPNPKVKMIICQKEHNAADDYIFENACENDIVVTRDILFAARLVEKNIAVMNDRGVLFSKDNIEEFAIAIEYKLTDEGLKVTIPEKEIYYNKNFPVERVVMLPGLMNFDNKTDGYFLLPDGSGSIMNFNNGKGDIRNASTYVTMYGVDNSRVVNEKSAFTPIFILILSFFILLSE